MFLYLALVSRTVVPMLRDDNENGHLALVSPASDDVEADAAFLGGCPLQISLVTGHKIADEEMAFVMKRALVFPEVNETRFPGRRVFHQHENPLE